LDSARLAAPLSLTSTIDESHRQTLSSKQLHSSTDVHSEAQTSSLTSSAHSRAQNAASPPAGNNAFRPVDVETRPRASSKNATSTQEVLVYHTSVEISQQATNSLQPSSVQQTVPSSVIETQYSFAQALAVLGSLALASSIVSGNTISAHLPYLIPLLALALLIPRQQQLTSALTTALIAGAFLLASSFTTFSGIQDLRGMCTEWIGNEPFSATAKLLLVATLISSKLLSSINLSVIAVIALNYLSGNDTRDTCSSGTAVRVSQGQTSEDGYVQGGYASWLGMMDLLSPVVAV